MVDRDWLTFTYKQDELIEMEQDRYEKANVYKLDAKVLATQRSTDGIYSISFEWKDANYYNYTDIYRIDVCTSKRKNYDEYVYENNELTFPYRTNNWGGIVYITSDLQQERIWLKFLHTYKNDIYIQLSNTTRLFDIYLDKENGRLILYGLTE